MSNEPMTKSNNFIYPLPLYSNFQEGFYFKQISNTRRRWRRNCSGVCGNAADGLDGAVSAVAHFVFVSFAIRLSRF